MLCSRCTSDAVHLQLHDHSCMISLKVACSVNVVLLHVSFMRILLLKVQFLVQVVNVVLLHEFDSVQLTSYFFL